jgi:hypothetical protein
MTIAEHRMTDYLEAGARPAFDTRAQIRERLQHRQQIVKRVGIIQ